MKYVLEHEYEYGTNRHNVELDEDLVRRLGEEDDRRAGTNVSWRDLAIARQLGLEVTAEDLEDEKDWLRLFRADTDFVEIPNRELLAEHALLVAGNEGALHEDFGG